MDKSFKLKSGEALLLTDESERRYFIDFDSSFGYVLITAEERVFYTDKRGNYNGMDNSLSFELLLQSVTLDGEDVHIPSTLKYDFDLLKK